MREGVGGVSRGDGRQCVALAVSLLGIVLGSQPAAGGEPIQSAVMESKVTVHSCKITLANCLSKRHGAEKHTYTQKHTDHSLSQQLEYILITRSVHVCGGVRGYVLLSLCVLVK